jgi:hypothetical protein
MVRHATDQGVTSVARKGDVLFLSQQRRRFPISAALHDGSSTRLMHGSLFPFDI